MRLPLSIQAFSVLTVLTVLLGTAVRADTALVVVGDGLTSAELDVLDGRLRAGGADLGPYQGGDVTRARIASAGLTCDWRDPDCLAQLGVISGTDQIVLVDVSRGAVRLTVVDVNAGKATRKASAADITAALAAVRLPAAQDAALVASSVATPPGSAPVAQEAPLTPLITAGVGVVAIVVGSGLAIAGTLAWLDRDAASATLAASEAQTNATTLAEEAFVTRVKAERAAFERADAQWESSGQPLVTVGVLVLGAGAGVATVSLAWAFSE